MKTENLPIEGEKEKAAGKTEKQAEHGKQKDSDISDREKENKEMKMKEKCVFEEKGDGKKNSERIVERICLFLFNQLKNRI